MMPCRLTAADICGIFKSISIIIMDMPLGRFEMSGYFMYMTVFSLNRYTGYTGEVMRMVKVRRHPVIEMEVKTSNAEYILDITLDSMHVYARIAAFNFKLVKMITHLVYLLKEFLSRYSFEHLVSNYLYMKLYHIIRILLYQIPGS